MKLLALDTSSLACSVALVSGDDILERHELKEREHTRLLVPMLRSVLAEAGLAPSGLDAVVLGNGPGSFIGLRIAASVAQGLCYGAGIPLVPVSSLAAVAAEAFHGSAAARVLVAQDAHMGEVYLAGFRRGVDDLPVAEGEVTLQPAGEIPRLAAADGWHAAGDGWRRHPPLLDANRQRLAGVLDVAWPRARFVLALGAAAWRAGRAIDPRALEPEYVRERVTA
jgi:tRNA threonylcarbamoyladenosine biosynthesis protein TsaB